MSETAEIPKRLLVAIGGNAFHPGDIEGTVEQQVDIAAHTGISLLPIMQMDNELVVTHGNGPVVGKILMRQVLAREEVVPMSLDICVAHSQGGIAYLLMQALENALREAGSQRHAVCLLTQVEVDADDPAFENPTKPIGFFYGEEQARDDEPEPALYHAPEYVEEARHQDYEQDRRRRFGADADQPHRIKYRKLTR